MKTLQTKRIILNPNITHLKSNTCLFKNTSKQNMNERLLKENLELEEENKRLEQEIAQEMQLRENILKQRQLLTARLLTDNYSEQNLTYSDSEKGSVKGNEMEGKPFSFYLTGNSSGNLEKESIYEDDMPLHTEEEMIGVNKQRLSIKKPRIFITMTKQTSKPKSLKEVLYKKTISNARTTNKEPELIRNTKLEIQLPSEENVIGRLERFPLSPIRLATYCDGWSPKHPTVLTPR